MKICCPVHKNIGLNSLVSETFSCAPEYIIADMGSDEVATVTHIGQFLQFGTCNPIDEVNGNAIDAIVTFAISEGQLHKFNRVNIVVYKAVGETVGENFELLRKNQLVSILSERAAHHTHS